MSLTLKQARAVIFDLDGTLLDTLEDLASATNDALEKNGFPRHPVDPYRYFVGSGLETLIFRALPEDSRDNATVKRCLDDFVKFYDACWDSKTRPYDGVEDMLTELKDLGVPMAVCTNKPQKFAEYCVERLLPKGMFNSVIGAVDGRNKKPAPDQAYAAAESLGVPSELCAFMGDTSVDIDTAVNAGMLAVGVLWGFRERRELEEHGATIFLSHPLELPRGMR